MSSTDLVRIQLVLSGTPGTAVTTSGAEDPVVHVRVGSVLTYCATIDVIAAHLETWRLALREATVLFGGQHVAAPPMAHDAGVDVTVIVRQDRPQRSTVARYTPRESRHGDRYLEVADGPVLHICRSLSAVEAVHAVWQDALELARVVWKRQLAYLDL